jgi:hypothetical protein
LATTSEYKAFGVYDRQYKVIQEYEEASKIPVYYLFYNPAELPWTVTLPSNSNVQIPAKNRVACRVVPAKALRNALAGASAGHHPTYAEVQALVDSRLVGSNRGGWTLESFIVDWLLACKEGHISNSPLR